MRGAAREIRIWRWELLVMAQMLDDYAKEVADVIVGQEIVDGLPLSTILHQVGIAEGAQLVGDGGLAHTQGPLETAYGELVFQ